MKRNWAKPSWKDWEQLECWERAKWKENVGKQKHKKEGTECDRSTAGDATYDLSSFSVVWLTCVDAFMAQDQLNQGAKWEQKFHPLFLGSLDALKIWKSSRCEIFFAIIEYHKKQHVLTTRDFVGGSADSVRPPRASSSGNAKGQAETHKTPMMRQPSVTRANTH